MAKLYGDHKSRVGWSREISGDVNDGSMWDAWRFPIVVAAGTTRREAEAHVAQILT